MARNSWYEPKPRERKPARGARGAVHRVNSIESGPQAVLFELCRCGAWRATVTRSGRMLVTDWSAPCSDSSPAKARDDAPLEP